MPKHVAECGKVKIVQGLLKNAIESNGDVEWVRQDTNDYVPKSGLESWLKICYD